MRLKHAPMYGLRPRVVLVLIPAHDEALRATKIATYLRRVEVGLSVGGVSVSSIGSMRDLETPGALRPRG
jgi:hypothetical protein